ncbi:MAG TPA: 2OG-Fe(II) oxygenase [Elusimicrobiota bacterium]|nr:2OG-Fe(II) oxygenase [Elusimicrobiota bacterium]
MKIKEEGRDIFSFQLFSPAECADILAKLGRTRRRWQDAVLAWPYASVRAVNHDDAWVWKLPLRSMSAALKPYVSAVKAAAKPAAMLAWEYRIFRFATRQAMLLRYEHGGHIMMHIDRAGPKVSGRIISLICYLNADYEGSRTYFPRQGARILSAPGKAVIFPSGLAHPHAAEKVASGTKFVIVDWLS